uniref:Putative secreted protein n=1 Tax=Anopheles triannulatus TaxID=58253 RepID=A0A2M4B6M7_9DIPT
MVSPRSSMLSILCFIAFRDFFIFSRACGSVPFTWPSLSRCHRQWRRSSCVTEKNPPVPFSSTTRIIILLSSCQPTSRHVKSLIATNQNL